jgi:hypothetical protein
MEKTYWIIGGALVGAVVAPVTLGVLGFSAIGPVAGTIASYGVGGVGGGATIGFSTLQSIAMTSFVSAKIGAVCGATVGAAKSIC